MAFKQLADLDASVTTSLGGVDKATGKKNPTSIEGYYIGTRRVESRKAKSGFCNLHIIQTAKGNVGVWGKTNLDQKMPQVTLGYMVRISFEGMVETRNNPMYKYKVEVDADNSIEVNKADSLGNEAAYSSSDDLYADDDGKWQPEASLEDEAEEELTFAAPAKPAKVNAKPPSEEQQAKVRALLAGNKAKSA